MGQAGSCWLVVEYRPSVGDVVLGCVEVADGEAKDDSAGQPGMGHKDCPAFVQAFHNGKVLLVAAVAAKADK